MASQVVEELGGLERLSIQCERKSIPYKVNNVDVRVCSADHTGTIRKVRERIVYTIFLCAGAVIQ
jgi:hypothetical protein